MSPQEPGGGPAAGGIGPLRPLTLGEQLSGAVRAIRFNPGATLLPAFLVGVLAAVINLLVGVALGPTDLTLGSNPTDAQLREAVGRAGLSILVTSLLTTLAAVLLAGLVTVAVSRAVLGTRVSLSQSWEALRPALGRLLLSALLVALIAAAALVAAGVILLSAPPSAAVLFLVLLPALMWFSVAAVFTSVVAVLEGFGPVASLRRSVRLVRGAWWRTFGAVLLAAFLAGLVASLVAAPFGTVAAAREAGRSLFAPALGQVLADTVTGPFVAAFVVLLYLDRRMRREGLAAQLQQALREPPAAGADAPPADPR
ncbi:MAG: hypothetical protein ACTHMZ_03445 [Actinomycetes bacterium]